MDEKHDIVIPIGIKSFCNANFEIKVAIASIRKYCKFTNRIIIVSQIEPIKELGDDIIWVYCEDKHNHDKDANIIEKIRAACEKIEDLTDDFIFWSDDQFITKDTYWKDTTPRYKMIYCQETLPFFKMKAENMIWYKRLIMTFERFPNNGYGCKFFEPHIPSPMNKYKFLDMCNHFDYAHENGITSQQLYYNYIGEKGVKIFDTYHCLHGELDWENARWVGYYDSSLRCPEFVNHLKKMFDIK